MSVRGVVMSINDGRATVLLPGGTFRSIPLRSQVVEIGQEIWLPEGRRRNFGWWAIPLVAVVGVAMILIHPFSPFLAQTPVAAVLSVDINPSINLETSNNGRVIGEVGLDRAGKRLLQQKPLVGLNVHLAVQDIVSEAYRAGYFSASTSDVVIGAVFTHHEAAWFASLSTEAAKILQQDRLHVSVVSVSGVSAKLVQAMEKPTVSVGRYLLWKRNASTFLKPLTLVQVRTMPVAKLIGSVVALPKGTGISSGPKTSPSISAKPGARSPTPQRNQSPSRSISTNSATSIFPNIAVSTPSISVTTPIVSLQIGRSSSPSSSSKTSAPSTTPSRSSSSFSATPPSTAPSSKTTPTASPRPPLPPSSEPPHSAPPLPNPITTVSSVLNQLGL